MARGLWLRGSPHHTPKCTHHQASPEIATTFPASVAALGQWPTCPAEPLAGRAGYFGRGLPKPGQNTFPRLQQGPLTCVHRALASGPGLLCDLRPLPVCLASGTLDFVWDWGGGSWAEAGARCWAPWSPT